MFRGEASVRDVPPRRNLFNDYSYSSSSRTGDRARREDTVDVTSPGRDQRMLAKEKQPASVPLGPTLKKNQGGTYVKRARRTDIPPKANQEPLGVTKNKKRSSKLVWMPVPVQVVGDEAPGSAGKRQRVNSVFDRLQSQEEEGQRTSSVFDRLEDPAADPAAQGRREQ
jgi:hypothetical protein